MEIAEFSSGTEEREGERWNEGWNGKAHWPGYI
jgi:hypothetical protein